MMPGLYVFAAVGIVAGALGFAGGWQTQGWRLGEQMARMKAEQAAAVADATREARAVEQKRVKELSDAQMAANARAQVARRDADGARTELERLRDAARAGAAGVPGESAGACVERAAAAADLLGQCAASYQELARAADGHANDARALSEAWPR